MSAFPREFWGCAILSAIYSSGDSPIRAAFWSLMVVAILTHELWRDRKK